MEIFNYLQARYISIIADTIEVRTNDRKDERKCRFIELLHRASRCSLSFLERLDCRCVKTIITENHTAWFENLEDCVVESSIELFYDRPSMVFGGSESSWSEYGCSRWTGDHLFHYNFDSVIQDSVCFHASRKHSDFILQIFLKFLNRQINRFIGECKYIC